MKRFLLTLGALGFSALAGIAQSGAEPSPSPSPTSTPGAMPTDAQVAARETALTLAGAFANDGFKVRDGYWTGDLTEGGTKTIEVNLYAGNQYWFSVGTAAEGKEYKVTVFDESGAQVNTESYVEGATAAAGLLPTASGPYYVQVEEVKGEPSTFCLVYSYK